MILNVDDTLFIKEHYFSLFKQIFEKIQTGSPYNIKVKDTLSRSLKTQFIFEKDKQDMEKISCRKVE